MTRDTVVSAIRLRRARFDEPHDDLEFLFEVYASSREEELAQVLDWSDAQKLAFLRDQFSLQHDHYQSHFPKADYRVICDGERPIGRLYVDRGDDLIRVLDIALLGEFRGRGIGGALMDEVLSCAEAAHLPVGLHVEATNPAKHLYERLGFRFAEDVGVYERMEWTPPG